MVVVVNLLALCSDDLSSNLAEVYNKLAQLDR